MTVATKTCDLSRHASALLRLMLALRAKVRSQRSPLHSCWGVLGALLANDLGICMPHVSRHRVFALPANGQAESSTTRFGRDAFSASPSSSQARSFCCASPGVLPASFHARSCRGSSGSPIPFCRERTCRGASSALLRTTGRVLVGPPAAHPASPSVLSSGTLSAPARAAVFSQAQM